MAKNEKSAGCSSYGRQQTNSVEERETRDLLDHCVYRKLKHGGLDGTYDALASEMDVHVLDGHLLLTLAAVMVQRFSLPTVRAA